MQKELYDKLSQLDRIEYETRKYDSNSVGIILFCILICTAIIIIMCVGLDSLFNKIYTLILMLVGTGVYFITSILDSYFNSELDKHFIKRLEIKVRK